MLGGVAFLASVGAVGTQLLGSRYTGFCFCSPPLAQPAFTAPADRDRDDAIAGGPLGSRAASQRAPIQVQAFNAPPAAAAELHGAAAFQERGVAHLGVLWGTDDHLRRSTSSSGGRFMGGSGGGGAGGMMMGHASSTTADSTVKSNKTSAPKAAPAPSHGSSPSHGAPAPTAPVLGGGAIVPPSTSGTFGSNADPVPGFGTGSTGSSGGTTGVTLGGTTGGTIGGGGKGLSVTPEPATLFLTLSGLLAAFAITRRRKA